MILINFVYPDDYGFDDSCGEIRINNSFVFVREEDFDDIKSGAFITTIINELIEDVELMANLFNSLVTENIPSAIGNDLYYASMLCEKRYPGVDDVFDCIDENGNIVFKGFDAIRLMLRHYKLKAYNLPEAIQYAKNYNISSVYYFDIAEDSFIEASTVKHLLEEE